MFDLRKMRPFLEELAERMIATHPRLEDLTMVFPNQRAALFFRSYLARLLTKPAWSPRLMTIEELFQSLSDLQEADRLSLVFRLYGVYRSMIRRDESFDKFYFWGEMLLRDFEEVDKYRVNASLLFKDLSKLHELDETFDYLTDEQRKFLTDFWQNFEDKPAGSKEEFLKVWRELPHVYSAFIKALRKDGLGYEGMIQRDVTDRLAAGKLAARLKSFRASDIVFAGFNALTKAEEELISHFVFAGAQVFWDIDEYYVSRPNQEAGQFFRQYQSHPVLGNTFGPAPTNFKDPAGKVVRFFGAPQKVGQAKLLGQLLQTEIVPKLPHTKQGDEIKTVIVLPDESMLMPVLHSLPAEMTNVNVTMGFPLRSTPLYNLLELMIELQINARENAFSHRQVTAILGHPYVLALEKARATEWHAEIIHNNRVFIPVTELQTAEGVLSGIFRLIEPGDISAYLLDIVQQLGASFDDRQSFDREYAFHFHRQLSRLYEVLRDSGSMLDVKGFQKLFRQVIQSQKIPFTGEPLKGLQVMGVLETRNLDFDEVFILSMNEGSLPAAQRQGSYIPHAIRKAYGLPTFEHQDATYAYLFYRVLQRAQNIRLLYNTEPDVLGTGEMSRFLQQIIYESGINVQHYILNSPVQLSDTVPIVIAKTDEVAHFLNRYGDPQGRGISPTALNDYIECPLRFYLKHVAGLREADEVEEELDARAFGNFLHDVMFWFYDELMREKKSKEIADVDLEPARVEGRLTSLIHRAFQNHYHQETVEYRGQRIVVREIVKQFAHRIIELDRAYAPFSLVMLEERDFRAPLTISAGGEERSILVGGRIDRVDVKGSSVRVIDYKTGKDEASFESIASLFARKGKRNKAAFQTTLYAWLLQQQNKGIQAIKPMLMNRRDLFEDGLKTFRMNREDVEDIRPALPEFEARLRKVLEELYDPAIPFIQTEEINNCDYCPFKDMCRR